MKKTAKTIAVVQKYFSPVTAGIEVNVGETYKVLVRQGWDVTIHTSKNTLTEYNVLPDNDNLNGIKIRRYVFESDNRGYFPDIDWENVDLICLHNFNIFFFWILVHALKLRLLGKKKFGLIVTPHGGFTPEWSIFPWKMRLLKQLYHYVVGSVLINLVVDRVRAVSEWERKAIIAKGVFPWKVVTISNGLEDEAYADVDRLASPEVRQLAKNLGRYIIQVGRVYPIKNLETTIRAMAKLPKDVKYLVVGPIETGHKYGTYKRELEKLIADLGLEDRVIFQGVVKGIDKYYLIKHAQMMVHMAIWESYCNVVHEGLSQGKVCIVANNTALPLLIKDGVNGFCVATKDDQALAEKINFVLDNKNQPIITDMETGNREIGLKDSWTEVAGRMEQMYNEVLKNYA